MLKNICNDYLLLTLLGDSFQNGCSFHTPCHLSPGKLTYFYRLGPLLTMLSVTYKFTLGEGEYAGYWTYFFKYIVSNWPERINPPLLLK